MEHLTDDPLEVILKLKRLEGEAIRECYPTVEMAQEGLENLAAVECWQHRETLLELISLLIEKIKMLGVREGRSEGYIESLDHLHQCIVQLPIESEREELLAVVAGLRKSL